MSAPTRRHVIAGSLAVVGVAGAPAIAEAKAPAHPPPTPEQWAKFFFYWHRLTPAQQRKVLARGEELLAEQEGRS